MIDKYAYFCYLSGQTDSISVTRSLYRKTQTVKIQTIIGAVALSAVFVACGSEKISVPTHGTQQQEEPSNSEDSTDSPGTDEQTDVNVQNSETADGETPAEQPEGPPPPPPVIAPVVQQTYEFTMTLPAGTRMLTDGIVANCPSSWVGECPPYYAFTFEGYHNGILYNFTVNIDQVDTGNRGYVTEIVEVQPDGSVTVTPTALSGATPVAADAGVPPVDDSGWGAAAARARSANHEFYFQLNADTPDQAIISALFAELMRPFRVTVIAPTSAQ